ncbi:hypothetical protein C8R47DRAFT_1329607 [Mycena vitilis]|nr:hypothetical protein C8R47DRAFT_1329607 [Mycena vitilis]
MPTTKKNGKDKSNKSKEKQAKSEPRHCNCSTTCGKLIAKRTRNTHYSKILDKSTILDSESEDDSETPGDIEMQAADGIREHADDQPMYTPSPEPPARQDADDDENSYSDSASVVGSDPELEEDSETEFGLEKEDEWLAYDEEDQKSDYGPNGYAIIYDMLRKNLPQALGEPIGSNLFCEAIEFTLFNTLESLVDKPYPWDEHDNSSNLISVKKFTYFVLVPQVAATLIAQDMECSDTEAVDVLEDSRRCGEVLNPVVVLETANDVFEVSAAPPRHDRKKLKQVNLLPKDTKPKAKPKAPVKTSKPTPGMDASPSKKTTSARKENPKAAPAKEKKEKKVVAKIEPTRKSARNTKATD